jgi:Holliday junction resolvasome RuvABC endonuclease subunit
MEPTYEPIRVDRVLAIDPISRGFGFVLIEQEGPELVDWGVKVCAREELACAVALRSLIARSEPTVIVFEDPGTARSLRRIALEGFVGNVSDGISDLAIPVRMYSREEVRQAFARARAKTKAEIADLLVRRFPELRGRKPPERNIWESEDVRTSIFDALSLALTHLASGDG